MIKHILLAIAFIFCLSETEAQNKYITKNGHINFYSSAPLEDITADNDQVVAILNTNNGDIQFAVLMKSFQFEKALMQEHFNENYVESDTYPKSKFTGKITNWEDVDLSEEGKYDVTVQGKLTLHGATQTIYTEGQLEISAGEILATTKFIVKPEDYKIKVPKTVKDNIAKEIEVNVKALLKPYKK